MKQQFGAALRPSKPLYQWDTTIRGLGIRINRNGSRTYVCKLNHKDRSKYYTIGPCDLLELEDVRNLVGRMKLQLRASGQPGRTLDEFLKAKTLPEAYGITFGDFAKVYVEEYAKVHKKSWIKDLQRIDYHLKPIWGKRSLNQITRADVKALHNKLGKTAPFAANRLLETISVMWREAVLMGYLPERQIKITAGIRRFKEQSRDRFLQEDEWRRFEATIDLVPGERSAKIAVKLALELGLRSGELINLKWSYVDLQRGEIKIPDTKGGRPFTLPLTAKARVMLSGLNIHNQWVFPSSRKRGQHIGRIDKLVKRVCCAAGIKDFRPHDIRRSVGCSVLAETGSLEMVASVLNHKSIQTTKRYAKYSTDKVRAALEKHSVNKQDSVPSTTDELSLRRVRKAAIKADRS